MRTGRFAPGANRLPYPPRQTCLPYRDPGEDVREWARINGAVHLEVIAGKAMHPELERFVPVGLPFGAKPRLVLAHLNAEALRTGSPVIQVEGSLRAFVLRLKLDTGGRTVSTIKDQLARLSASSIRLGLKPSFDEVGGACQQERRNVNADVAGSLQIDDKLELRRLCDR
jgi:hypothetical protein